MIRAISLTTAGGVALFSYFFHIDYFPLFDLQGASSYLFGAAYVLVLVQVLFAILLVIPYILKLFMESRLKNLAPRIAITATSAGSTNPPIKDCNGLAPTERIKCEAPNRRVEVEIAKKQPVHPE